MRQGKVLCDPTRHGGTRPEIELSKHTVPVRVDRARADSENGSDLTIRKAVGDSLRDFGFSDGEGSRLPLRFRDLTTEPLRRAAYRQEIQCHSLQNGSLFTPSSPSHPPTHSSPSPPLASDGTCAARAACRARRIAIQQKGGRLPGVRLFC